jgi:alpha-D-xyloside xylohydrolase
MRSVPLFLAACAATATAQITLTITPWCSNSFRVQLTPPVASFPATAAASSTLQQVLTSHGLEELPAALIDSCGPGAAFSPSAGGVAVTNGNLGVKLSAEGVLDFFNVATAAPYFSAQTSFASGGNYAPYLAATVTTTAGDANERFFGLGQTNWTNNDDNGCPSGLNSIVPLQRNGQTINLQQTKFHVSIPFVYSTAGYGFLYNMPGYGVTSMGEFGTGGMSWRSDAALALDFWVTGLPAGASPSSPASIYHQYADATGHAPPLREDAMIFWQSRLRYKSSAIALQIAEKYKNLQLPVGVLVVDFYNQLHDGNFQPNPACFPSLLALTSGVRDMINATVVFSVWPEVEKNSTQRANFEEAGCLSNDDLGGSVLDTTIPHCRDLIWSLVKPNYYDGGVSAFWLDETDGEGTDGGDGTHGYDTSFGPAAAFSQLWIGSWLQTFTQPVAMLGEVAPLALTRGVWAGGQRNGVVLWSSDIESTFETLAAMVPQGVHSSMSGIPWWTSDVGGFGCTRPGSGHASNSTYFQELIVRWYQFGLFCPVFRTHGCRQGSSEPNVEPCVSVAGSCGSNEVWAYGDETALLLSDMVLYRANVLKPYIASLAQNVSAEGVPTMRPLWYEFPADAAAYNVDDQYMLGPLYLVAPVTVQNATSRSVVFPAGAKWQSVWDASVVENGGQTKIVQAPLNIIPVYKRV